ncbi:P-loop containing nucleoside triphosphate hydrolase protein [Anaeromyces robustus]|uniref:p-loop containing nucleoside triphosphate hydrolase protein n=1 Tax=Anaeromyces robustus TaxID=1754192 RepID=A0A1Y1XHU0_9FUNG|nr:P-loop containing nucleoside triphosphate hydrolase protein [Anaeromyces robustus]|eukprot:ORX85317.1 P-loop containing nucleoside triphosphate hydrolase protein [Anaeromyces robustus]
MDRKKTLSFISSSSSSSNNSKLSNNDNKNFKKKKEILIDLTVSDEENNTTPPTSSNNSVIKNNPKKKRKLNNSKSFSPKDNNDDDELSDDLFSSFPDILDIDLKDFDLNYDLRFNNNNNKSYVQKSQKDRKSKKNVRFLTEIEYIDVDKKNKKGYKITNIQESIHKYLNSTPKRTKNNIISDSETNNIETQLWIDKFIPNNSSELAVHKKKIEEVRNWLIYNIIKNKTKKPSLLILTGPTGSGKTATLRVLAEELNIEIVEWTNPINTLKISESNQEFNFDDENKKKIKDNDTTITEKFEHFFISANKYPSLQFEYEPGIRSQESYISDSLTESNSSMSLSLSSSSTPNNLNNNNNLKNYKYKIILLEDVPLLTNIHAQKKFHNLIQSYFNSSKSVYSLIFIISEILAIDDDSYKKQEFSIKTYIPTSVLNSNICHIIYFNPIAETYIAKVLNNLSKKYLPPSKHLNTKLLRIIGLHTNGDIRSAINTFQFLYLFDDPEIYISKKAKSLNIKTIGKSIDPKFRKKEANNLFSSISNKNTHLSLFHILGKILYNKRLTTTTINNNNIISMVESKFKDDSYSKSYNFEFSFGDHLKEHERLPLEDEPDEIINQSQVDPRTLLLFLEQNLYSYYEEIEELEEAFKYICLTDQFQSQWKYNKKDFSLYSQYVTMYGLLHAHTNPIPEFNKLKKMYKPEEWSANKLIDQNNKQLNDILLEWSDVSNNPFKMPFRTEHTSKSNIITEIFPYLSKITSKSNHILNREIKNSDKQFLNYINNYTNPRTNENWWDNTAYSYSLYPQTIKENILDDEMDEIIPTNKYEDEFTSLTSNITNNDIEALDSSNDSIFDTISIDDIINSNNLNNNNNNNNTNTNNTNNNNNNNNITNNNNHNDNDNKLNQSYNFMELFKKREYDKFLRQNNTSDNSQPIKDKIDLFEIEDDEIEEID